MNKEQLAKREEHLAMGFGGWITETGIYIPCTKPLQHIELAFKYSGQDEKTVEQWGWLKIGQKLTGDYKWDIHLVGCPTQKQLDTLWDWVNAETNELERLMRKSAMERATNYFGWAQASMEHMGRGLGLGADFSLLTIDGSNPDFLENTE
ncbi:hypothetical protein LCGC14_2027400 [marine sediment metagenome]|uniref:Uncharacterized protein n=1 Tax=marine sediment metagenome TaxID=412755 RepID=A0A0F9EVQ7_9ZZZZ